MNSQFQVFLVTLSLLCSFAWGEDEKGNPMAYDSINRGMKVMASKEIEGEECVGFYLKSTKEEVKMDPKKANFLVRTQEGVEVPLKVEAFADIKEENLTDLDKERMKEGFTHRLWIPKNKKAFKGGDVVHYLPKGSVRIEQGLKLPTLKGKIPLR